MFCSEKDRLIINSSKIKDCDVNNIYFVPFVMDTYGNFGKDALDFLRRLARQLSDQDLYGKSFDQILEELIINLSFTLQNMIASQLSSFPGCR
jgi:hypothetical protein